MTERAQVTSSSGASPSGARDPEATCASAPDSAAPAFDRGSSARSEDLDARAEDASAPRSNEAGPGGRENRAASSTQVASADPTDDSLCERGERSAIVTERALIAAPLSSSKVASADPTDAALCELDERGAIFTECALIAAPLEVFRAAPGDAVLWEPEGRPAVIAVGAAKMIVGRGPSRVAMVREAAREVGRWLAIGHGATPVAPTFFGGFAFEEEVSWAGFGAASFVLPRWWWSAGPDGATVSIAIPPGPDAPSRLVAARAEIAAVLAAARLGSCCEPAAASTGIKARTGADSAEPVVGEGQRSCASGMALPPVAAPNREARTGAASADATGRARAADAQTFRASVATAVEAARRGELDKVVLSRAIAVEGPVDPCAILDRLEAGWSGTTRFAFRRGAETFLGMTPETLVEKQGATFRSESLAGTCRVSSDGGDASRLLHSAKERGEHAHVVRYLQDKLSPLCLSLKASRRPEVRRLPRIAHLCTPVSGVLREGVDVLEAVGALHPTPATAGTPLAAARAFIARHEPMPRGWYAGAIGWFDAAGDGDFRVALRSARVGPDGARVFAGAGIVEGSDPDRELAETELKASGLLAALEAPR